MRVEHESSDLDGEPAEPAGGGGRYADLPVDGGIRDARSGAVVYRVCGPAGVCGVDHGVDAGDTIGHTLDWSNSGPDPCAGVCRVAGSGHDQHGPELKVAISPPAPVPPE